MRSLAVLVLVGALLGGCGLQSPEPYPGQTGSTGVGEPGDTLPVLGAWVSEPVPETGRRLILTLTDDNRYVVTDTCSQAPGRWDLRGDQVLLTPDESGVVLCGGDEDPPLELADALTVERGLLVPTGTGPVFSRK
ncbi:hypothetical protein H1W00_00215 [Aeromicrobium sp. Marseille-Q0843]|uniref:DUF306 domain-containing protein n=1 Tax=Aeromicrobium phoceense TaxID=2754045 RepID=A0A838XAN4_9ACTN|nr:hypothetical protein [Aeromicrobium phoceense]MBA4606897.1 hypothetical protein [Aeromicrobium phoceense]